MSKEAMKLALEALEDLSMKHFESTGEVLHKEVFDVLKEALAKQEQCEPEPVAWMSNKDFEPIRRRIMGEAYELAERDVEGYNAIKMMCGDVQEMLPAQRQWVGLTDEEVSTLWGEWKDAVCLDYKTWAEAIQAKLKELNT
jgi:hypothetical protein